MKLPQSQSIDEILGTHAENVETTRLYGEAPEGSLPISADDLINAPSGDIFGLTQNVGMGWGADELGREQYLILSTHGGLRHEDGSPIALGYHTGHWEINLLVRKAAETFRAEGTIPFAAYCTDPCDGRTQGTTGMFDSLPYRNDAAIVMRRLIRSLPTRDGILGIATCDKGLPAMMLALAGSSQFPGVLVPGGVTLPSPDSEDLGTVQTIGTRFAQNLITLEYAQTMGCRACGSAGGGCQFLGTAATAQVIGEALGLSLPHSALSPSGELIWLDMARRSALALVNLTTKKIPLSAILTQEALENAMLLHAAFGGSTNLLLHIPAIAHAAGLKPPTVEDWQRINRSTPRLVDALPNGPHNYPTIDVFMAGGVPEVMLHLRKMGLLNLGVMTVSGQTLGENLDWWEHSERRQKVRTRLTSINIDPDTVIMTPDTARSHGLTSTVIFPSGNIAPDGAVIKATSIDPSVVDSDNVYRHRGTARVFTSEHAAIQTIKGRTDKPLKVGELIVLMGIGPMGTGMEEIYQITSALKFIPSGKHIPVITDGRFSGVSTGACIGHVGPEALSGGPISKLRDGDIIEIEIDRTNLTGHVNFVGTVDRVLTPVEADLELAQRKSHPDLHPHEKLPDDTRLWAALQEASGGTWAGCVYDVDKIIEVIRTGLAHLDKETIQNP